MQAVKSFVAKLTDSSSDDDEFFPRETDHLLINSNEGRDLASIVIDTETMKEVDVNLDDISGLTSLQAREALAIYGPNMIDSKKESLFVTILKHLFLNLISVLIWLAVITTCIVQDWVDLGVLIFLQTLNTIIMFNEKRKSENALSVLQEQLCPTARVLRDGVIQEMDAKNVVPGDVVKLSLGCNIPADCIVSSAIQVEQSGLTGESLPVNKKKGEAVFCGSHCTKGESLAVVTQTGFNTLVGKQAKLIEGANQIGPFEVILKKISYTLLICAAVLIVIICIIQLARGKTSLLELTKLANLALVLLVAAIPVGLQAVCSTTMAVGARRLAKQGVIVCKLTALLDLASMKTLCSDKTGTLTKNVLSLTEPWTNGDITHEQLTLFACLASDYTVDKKDAIDHCIVSATPKHLLDDWEQLSFEPFDPSTKRTESVVRNRKTNETMKIIKGSPQTLLQLARFREKGTKDKIEEVVEGLAARGLRSLGVCVDYNYAREGEGELPFMNYVGVISLHDPPRDDSLKTIAGCGFLGIGVKMISGDHRSICENTCKQLKMPSQIVASDFFDNVAIKPKQLIQEEINAAGGFAEVLPEHKYFVVDALQGTGVVGMTGDGVNDSSALKKADIGIAVEGASDAARAASDIVLSKPGIGSIVSSVVRSRKIFERLRNYISFRIVVSVGVLVANLILIAAHDFQMPPLAIVFHVILMDLTVLVISRDKVFPSQRPCEWKITELAVVSIIVGLLGAVEVYVAFWLARGGSLFFSSNLSLNELRAIVYLALSLGSQLSIFCVRTKSLFFTRRPGFGLMIAVGLSVVTAVIISVYVQFIETQDALLWKDCACVLVVCIAGFLVKDVVKTLLYGAFEQMEKASRKQQLFYEHNKELLM